MAAKHLDVTEWGTSNPIYERLQSSLSDREFNENNLGVFGITL